ncbi:Maf-like protein [Vibrio sp. Isolate31]|uniref:Maf family protein n=1 Tax=unclassified Vibrio TaxID=2614977 RepID=UPI001EFEE209|nr:MULTISPECIES: nucleoside triphosphate pyrophosphatase [unclassified Vibrio]MCG9551971.1 Maf-like protein [Vibrio sp. Isolate32]MCG9602679.1 Maf-like protein [Vibrio sp. Isolate31]
MKNYQLVLASTSPFRQEILKKLQISFITAKPDCDETPISGETPQQLVMRLAETKAKSCVVEQPSLVIGSDQVCVIDGEIIGKPHTRGKAIEQLSRQSGKSITFYTGITVWDSETQQADTRLDTFIVHFRDLTEQQIISYVEKEEPYWCAGSFKCEGLGIALFKQMEGKDPNTLIGLPLIDLVDMLDTQGMSVL